jgi:hypothetical protein
VVAEVGRYRLIGRTREARSFTKNPISFLDYRVGKALAPLHLQHRTTYILVKLAPGTNPEAVRDQIQRRLPHNDVRVKAEWAARSRNYWVENTGLGLSMYMTVFLGCLVGVVVVAQTSYTATMDHFKEFAVVKAIGRRTQISIGSSPIRRHWPRWSGLSWERRSRSPAPAIGWHGFDDDHSVELIVYAFVGAGALSGGFADLVPRDRRA